MAGVRQSSAQCARAMEASQNLWRLSRPKRREGGRKDFRSWTWATPQ